MPRVSIICNVRDRGWCLRDALDSALAQTYQDWELILVDDASSDDTWGIMTAYAERDNRIQAFAIPGGAERDAMIAAAGAEAGIGIAAGGLGLARRYGTDKGTGEIYAGIDSDDIWEPHHLTTMIAYLDANPGIAGGCGNAHLVNRAGDMIVKGREIVYTPADVDLRSHALGSMIHSATVIRYTAMSAVGGVLPLAACDDWDIVQRLAWAGQPLTRPGPVTIRRRMHNQHMEDITAADVSMAGRRICLDRSLDRLGLDVAPEDRDCWSDLRGGVHGRSQDWWSGLIRTYDALALSLPKLEEGLMEHLLGRLDAAKPEERQWAEGELSNFPRLNVQRARRRRRWNQVRNWAHRAVHV